MGSQLHLDQHTIDEFIAEAREHLSTIEDDFLVLETQSDAPDPDLVDKVFRAVHSIKGGAAFAGLIKINELAHAMENLLSAMRDGVVAPQPAVINGLLKGVDLLSSMAQHPETSNGVDVETERRLLHSLLPDAASSSGKKVGLPAEEENDPPTPETPPRNTPETLLDLDSLDIPGLLREFDYVYVLRFEFDSIEDSDALFKELTESGSIAAIAPELGEGAWKNDQPGNPVKCDIVYATLLDPDMVELVTDLPAQRIHLLAELSTTSEPASLEHNEAHTVGHNEVQYDKDFAHRIDDKKTSPLQQPENPLQSASFEPSATVRINVGLLDKLMALAGELVLVRNQQLIASDVLDGLNRDIVQRLDVVTTDLQSVVMRTRMQPVGNVLGKLPRMVRDLSAALGKSIRVEASGGEAELDKTILESLADPLTHIIRNCCDHGIEVPDEREKAGKPRTGLIRVAASHEGGQITIACRDDGRGIDPDKIKRKALEMNLKTEAELDRMSGKELLRLIMAPGFSTAETVSGVSGRGVGMDVVKHSIENLGGSLDIDSQPGQGTVLVLRLPLTLAIIPSLIVAVDGRRFAIPQVNVQELICLYDDDVFTRIEVAGSQEVFRLRDRLLPVIRLSEALQRAQPFTHEVSSGIAQRYYESNRKKALRFAQRSLQLGERDMNLAETLSFAVVKAGSSRYGLIVDQVLGTEEIVVKPMHPALKHLGCYCGATIMGDGGVCLILDVEGLARHAGISFAQHGAAGTAPDTEKNRLQDVHSVLLFRYGVHEQYAVVLPVIQRIQRITPADIETVGEQEFVTVDGVPNLVLRLDAHLSVSPCVEREVMYLLLPKFASRPFGLLMSDIIDAEEAHIQLRTDGHMEDGLLGTDIVRGYLTLFPDCFRLIELAEPVWSEERRNKQAHTLGRRVLAVEDSSIMRSLVRNYLEADAHLVTTAADGREALSLMQTQDFDVIVSDIDMPVMDGLEFIESVRRSDRHKHIPAIALTGLESEEDRRKALDSGFDEYLIKMDRERFLAAVASIKTARTQPA